MGWGDGVYVSEDSEDTQKMVFSNRVVFVRDNESEGDDPMIL